MHPLYFAVKPIFFPIFCRSVFAFFYLTLKQERVIDSSQWVEEHINQSVIIVNPASKVFLPAPSLFIYLISVITAAIARKNIRYPL